MTQEEKQLLLVDLCSRLPYKVKCSYERILPEGYLLSDAQTIGTMDSITIPFVEEITVKIDGLLRGLSDFKMYLRPLSSMTEEEEKEYHSICDSYTNREGNKYYFNNVLTIDWYNRKHFDYRGLIDKGLAIEAPKDMYN